MNELINRFLPATVGESYETKSYTSFIRRNHYMLFDGEEVLVKDFEPDPPYHSAICEKTIYSNYPPNRPDEIKVLIDGKWHDFDAAHMQALPVPEEMKPARLNIGARIRIHGCDDNVQRLYLLKTPEDSKGKVAFDCDVLHNCTYTPGSVLIHRSGARIRPEL